nr:hypothetical protein [Tanacetum cinerariifolium]
MVAYLTKSDASEGFNQIIDFLNESYIKYALMVNLNIFVSCIKQFWNTVAIKQVIDVTRLQALVDKKRVVVTVATIREVLRLDDAEVEVPAASLFAAPARVAAAPRRRRKGVDVAIDHVKLKVKEDPTVQRFQAMKRKPQTEAQARKNMMMYLKNVASFKLDYINGMSYDDICLIFETKFNSNVDFLLKIKEQMEEEEENIALQTINETPVEKAAKRRKLNEEVEDLKRHHEIVPDEDDDVYTKSTPLARKVLIVDYEIIELNNKPYYKIIRADGTHQSYIRFLTLLKNFKGEDLEALWNLVKERFSTSKPKNFSDDFLLPTLGAMFEKPDAHAQIWKNQRTVHGQAKVKSWKLLESCGVHIITFTTTQLILLIERRYPLSRFTLDQMLNAVRLQVEEESEVSLELLRFTR